MSVVEKSRQPSRKPGPRSLPVRLAAMQNSSGVGRGCAGALGGPCLLPAWHPTALGIAQILAWGSSFYFPAVLAQPIVADTGWSFGWVVGGTSIGLLVAGLIAPRVGIVIDRRAAARFWRLIAALRRRSPRHLCCPDLSIYLLGWVVVGLGMGSGLYDAVFAALGKLYGRGARTAITNLTLFGGFASTVCWPLSALLAQSRLARRLPVDACLHLAVLLPLQMAVMPPLSPHPRTVCGSGSRVYKAGPAVPQSRELTVLALLALVLTISAGVGSIAVAHLSIFLQARRVDYALAVTLGTLFGPAQVGARVVERLSVRHHHPILTTAASCVLMRLGLSMLLAAFPSPP